MFPVCPICNARHHERQAHRFATNTEAASNNASNIERGRVDEKCSWRSDAGLDEDQPAGGRVVGADSGAGDNRKQRWSREAYNAYQREYMRKRRACT